MRLMFATVAFALSQPLLAAEPAPAPSAKPIKEQTVCRVQDLTGSRLGSRRVCKTATQWAEIDARDAEQGRIPFTRAVPPPPKAGPGGN